jgi:CHAT domain-containing protein/tetratricopeptide (TPR) repeat protein
VIPARLGAVVAAALSAIVPSPPAAASDTRSAPPASPIPTATTAARRRRRDGARAAARAFRPDHLEVGGAARRLRAVLVVALMVARLSPATAAEPASPRFTAGEEILEAGRYADAAALARARLAELEAAGGGEDLEAAAVLDVLVHALVNGRNFADAKAAGERCLALKTKLRGEHHRDLVRPLSLLGTGYREAGEYASSRVLLERAVAIARAGLPADDPWLAASIGNLGYWHVERGDLDSGRQLLEEALGILEHSLGAEHPKVAAVLMNLANARYFTAELTEARSLYERALAIQERALGPEHPNVALTLNNLANVHSQTGDYLQARVILERVLAMRRKVLGPEHPNLGLTLNNLANTYVNTGEYEAARRLYEQALALREKTLGPAHPEVAQSLGNLAGLLVRLHDYEAAAPLLERGLAIVEQAHGPRHAQVATALNRSASLAVKRGELARARPLYERAISIWEESSGSEHPNVAIALHGHGGLLLAVGDAAAARAQLERALAIRERALGAGHPLTLQTLARLAETLRALGQSEPALAAALRAEAGGRELVRVTVGQLAERQALAFAASRPAGLDVALALLGDGSDATASRRVLDSLVRSRAIVLDEMAARHRAVAGSEGSATARLRSELQAATRRLANLFVQGPGSRPELYVAQLEEARSRKEEAERALAANSAAFRAEQARASIGLAEVEAVLPAGAALVSFARFGGEGVPAELAAFVLRADGTTTFVRLGPAAEVDDLVGRWRALVRRPPPASAGRAAEREYRLAAGRLRERVWDPLLPSLGEARLVFLVPDGDLHLVSFASLSVEPSGYLVEVGPLLHLLAAERDLVEGSATSPAVGSLLAVGGPAFDAPLFAALREGLENRPAIAAGAAALPAAAAFRSVPPRCSRFRDLRFAPLPATEREAERIAAAWREAHAAEAPEALVLRGADASESELKRRATGRRVLHLATHAFFLDDDDCPSSLPAARGIGGLAPADERESAARAGDNPLLRAGLVFAGANRRAAAAGDEDDGILTAEEIAALDLHDVDWAVLSACDTGAGEVVAGEGVLGLRRAFHTAGAGSLVMSLWAVEDEWARAWMEALYDARLRRRAGTAEAVRAASLAMLGRLRREGRPTHPFRWAGFVAVGDWH